MGQSSLDWVVGYDDELCGHPYYRLLVAILLQYENIYHVYINFAFDSAGK